MQGEPLIFIIGRENRRHPVDIPIPAMHDTVSARHAQISIGPRGDLHLADLGSANGTFVQEANGRWTRVEQAVIGRGTRILLGEYQTTGEELLRSAPHFAGQCQPAREIPIVPAEPLPADVAPPPPVGRGKISGRKSAPDTEPSRYVINPETGEKQKVAQLHNGRSPQRVRRDPETGEIVGQ